MQPNIRANRDIGERELVQLRWGLVPFSTKSLADLKGKGTINARAETIMRGWWAQPFKKRRCLVPASGYMNGRTTKTRSLSHSTSVMVT
jgi:putative SOS response-associated peptidase YedK